MALLSTKTYQFIYLIFGSNLGKKIIIKPHFSSVTTVSATTTTGARLLPLLVVEAETGVPEV